MSSDTVTELNIIIFSDWVFWCRDCIFSEASGFVL